MNDTYKCKRCNKPITFKMYLHFLLCFECQKKDNEAKLPPKLAKFLNDDIDKRYLHINT